MSHDEYEDEQCHNCGAAGVLGEDVVLCCVCYGYCCTDCCTFNYGSENYTCSSCKDGLSLEGEGTLV